MNTSIFHLPELKQQELQQIVTIVHDLCSGVVMVVLFGSYARGDWKDGPHEQGRGKLTIHKKSDYDILVMTQSELVAKDSDLWASVKHRCDELGLSASVRIIARDYFFINCKLSEGQYFFTEVIRDGIALYDNGSVELENKKQLDAAKVKDISQSILDDVFKSAKSFYEGYEFFFNKGDLKQAAFMLHQACEHAYKTVLLIFGGECPQEHHLDDLNNDAIGYCPDLNDIFPMTTNEEKERFELLDYAYIGARYDHRYQITKEQLELLAPCVKKLHEIVERDCRIKIDEL